MSNQAVSFVLNSDFSLAGIIPASTQAQIPEDQMIISSADDLTDLSLANLTDIFNAATGKTVNKFSIAKTAAVTKVMAALNSMDISDLPNLGEVIEAQPLVGEVLPAEVIETSGELTGTELEQTADTNVVSALDTKTEEVIQAAPAKPVKKVSMLRRMEAIFKSTVDEKGHALMYGDTGAQRTFSIDELSEMCETSDDRTHQYISILKNPKDRFSLNISKTADKRYYLVPERRMTPRN